jgi:chemotaxis protein methyltransferase CheR
VNTSTAAHPLVADPAFPLLKQYLIESTGLAYYADKDADLAARIGARLSQLTLRSCAAYLELLKDRAAGESERHLLIGQLTIGETYFFRHVEQLDGLRDRAIPELIEKNRDRRTLRIWSAGCAVGAEPYSIAIMLKQHFATALAGWDVRILGTDINQAFLATAERGVFEENAFRSMPEESRRAWFTQSGRSWIIRPPVKEWVSFQYHNLVEHPYPSLVHGIAALDLILCRNVMIYFDWGVIERILGRFHDCLVDGGWLAVGHAESNPDAFRRYKTVSVPGATLYTKTGEDTPGHSAWVPPMLPVAPLSLAPVSPAPRAAHPLSDLTLIRRLADEGKWLEAASRCEETLALDELNPIVHFLQALILEQMRRDEDAEAAFRRAIYLDRGFALAHYHLALLLAKTGRRASALLSLRNVERLLSNMRGQDRIADADGLTAADLGELTVMHMELWQR